MNTSITLTFSALAEPNRLRIVMLLREGARSVGEIAARLQLRQPQVSKHLRILSDVGLVKAQPNAQQRIYQLQAQPFADLDTWLDTFSRVWEQRVNTLDNYLQDIHQRRGE